MAGIAPILAIGGTLLSAVGAVQQGRAAEAAANFEAAQLKQQAQAERASSQAAAREERRQKRLRLSRATAVAAAGGGGTPFDVLSDIEEEGEYRALTALWEGEERAKGRTLQAKAARFGGQQVKRAGFIKGATTLLDGGTSFMEKYG